jgi:hypothetical protein
VIDMGFDPKTFRGPSLTVLHLAAEVFLPLLVLELYLRAQAGDGPRRRLAVAAELAYGQVNMEVPYLAS